MGWNWSRTVIVAALSVGVLAAQDLPDYPNVTKPDGGFMPARTFNISDLDSISVTSGNLVFQLPLTDLLAGRAGFGGELGLTYNSGIWELQSSYYLDEGDELLGEESTISLQNELQKNDAVGDRGGWQYGFEYKLVEEIKEDSVGFGGRKA